MLFAEESLGLHLHTIQPDRMRVWATRAGVGHLAYPAVLYGVILIVDFAHIIIHTLPLYADFLYLSNPFLCST